MPFDGLFLYNVCHELNSKLCQGRIEKIYQPAREEIVLIISKPGKKYRLLVSANAQNARVHLTRQSSPNPTMPPMFCMLLRKHLEGGKIIGFHQPGLDRVLDIRVDCRDELGRPAVKSLLCEIMGRHSNIILVSKPDNTILDGIRRYGHAVSRHREVLPGQPYIPPPESHKINPLEATEEDFREAVMSGQLDDQLAVAMQKALDGLSIPTCRELVKLAGLNANMLLDHCGEHELRSLWQAWQPLATSAREDQLQAMLVCNSRGEPVDFFPLPAVADGKFSYTASRANEIADMFFSRKQALEVINKQRNLLLGIINKESKRIKKKLALQKKSVVEAEEADRYRLYGELLTANIYLLKRGMEEIELENYHDPEAKTIVIPLDKALSPSENAQYYYKKYNKANNTRKAAGKMARLSEEELQYLEGVKTSLDIAEDMDDLEEIRQELTKQGYIKKPAEQPGKKRAKDTKKQIKPLQYVSDDGFTVLVGKNNRQNDLLTLKTAEDSDIWLHTCKIPGSHVIIRTGGREVPEKTLLEAAALAAYYSRARESTNVPVDYTLRKYVKKPNGAKPGYVIYEKQRTVFVDPRPDAMQLV
ncbi:Rqc2 family fibronectin-binding protein [Desulfallas thermosapovorans]|uniref:Rqc2 homolog RqcH n=1 Tax=Desulfallas thermosapovorans DSM 6562 TaxID=1121431 RepID=A0A5S4ZWP7_9FIRM|nr:NFACT RNA binding domain-containing protein [Desulfallas thermosapovorans]TYO97455.1 putative ribosome quality control (RQC) complex YloA/Tae2 family protein [Desulfallas thermosapovorans DSM 6562]